MIKKTVKSESFCKYLRWEREDQIKLEWPVADVGCEPEVEIAEIQRMFI